MTALSEVAQRAELIERFSAAWEIGDVDALMELMGDDCTFRASVGPEPGATFSGREQVRRGFERFLAAAVPAPGAPPDAGPTVGAPQTVTEPPLICADFAVTRWTTRIPQAEGAELVVRACDVFGFEGGLIKFKDTYRKAAGELPNPR